MTPAEYYENVEKLSKDHVATPAPVVTSIYGRINIFQFNMVWLPFNNYDSEFKKAADVLKLKYRATHKFDDLKNDFFTTEPPEGCDLMISNPPFSIQNDIIRRSFELADAGKIKSFALLLPQSTIETRTRAAMWEAHESKLSMIVFVDRIKFKGKKTGFNKGCCWMCYNIPGLPKLSWIWR